MLAGDKITETRRGIKKLITLTLHCMTEGEISIKDIRRSYLSVNRKNDAIRPFPPFT